MEAAKPKRLPRAKVPAEIVGYRIGKWTRWLAYQAYVWLWVFGFLLCYSVAFKYLIGDRMKAWFVSVGIGDP
jgi:hypothetical protein